MKETILLTGFGPFGAHPRNVSGEAAQRLDGREFEGFRVRAIVLPVDFARAAQRLEEAWSEVKPSAVLCCGIHADADSGTYRLEVAARNARSEALGADPEPTGGEALEPGGPPMVFSTLPTAAMRRALADAGFDVELSDDAGSYLCNAAFYWTARRVAPAGFVHVPPADAPDRVAQALELCLEATVARLLAARVEATA
ncbi:MAG: pyroglutamyl-peptidase I [Planctomycetota bacterium]|nr:MAG: pyroglutamyl-peptidase I [Planctomycetota bacterium]